MILYYTIFEVVARYESRISELRGQLSSKCDEVVRLKERLSVQEGAEIAKKIIKNMEVLDIESCI